jgi:hypothetical protein
VLSVGRGWLLSVCCRSVGIGYCVYVVSRCGLDTLFVMLAGRDWLLCVLSVGRDRILSCC